MAGEIMSYRETHDGEVRERFTDKTVNDAFKLNEDMPILNRSNLVCTKSNRWR